MGDEVQFRSEASASVNFGPKQEEAMAIKGHYDVICHGPDGKLKWSEVVENTVVTVGKNFLFDNSLAGAAYTVVGPFMGLVSGASAPTVVVGDTMASHAGWLESGGTNPPAYTAPRKTCAWSAATGGAKALSAGLVFAITSSGTVAGVFIVSGTGALSTIDNTAGTLVSAGTFTGGNKVVGSGDTITATYTISA